LSDFEKHVVAIFRFPHSLSGFSFDKHAFTTVKFFENSTNAVK
jgi:hypothetical protein